MADDERRAKIEAVLHRIDVEACSLGWRGSALLIREAVRTLRGLLADRVRDARGDDEAVPGCSFHREKMDTNCWACIHNQGRSPQDEDHKAGRLAKLADWLERDRREPDKVIAYAQEVRRLAVSPSRDGTVSYEAVRGLSYDELSKVERLRAREQTRLEEWAATLQRNLDMAIAERDALDRDGTVAVEDVAKWMRLKVFGWGGSLAEEFLAEFSPASTGDREDPNPGTGHGQ